MDASVLAASASCGKVQTEETDNFSKNYSPDLKYILYLGGLRMPSTHVPTMKEVAMKFTPPKFERSAINEYEIYTYLNAINNASVEMYGIPTVYYFGKWNDYVLMAITLLDTKFDKIFASDKIIELDVLIMFREFVSSTMPLLT